MSGTIGRLARPGARRKERKLEEICAQVTHGKMPMTAYTDLHPQARLSDQERTRTCAWAEVARKGSEPAP